MGSVVAVHEKWFRMLTIALLTLAIAGAVLMETVSIYGGDTDQRFLLVLLIWLLVPVALLPGAVTTRSWLMAGWGVFVVAVAFSTGFEVSYPSDRVEAVFYPAYLAAIAAVIYLFRAADGNQSVPLWLLLIATVAMIVYALIAVMIYSFVLLDGLKSLDNHLPWGFYNIRLWNHTATWLLPLLPLAVLVGPLKQHRLWRFTVAFTGTVWWWLLLHSMGRGSLLGLIGALLLILLVMGRASLPWVKVFVGYLVMGIVVWLLLSWLLPMLLTERSALSEIRTHSSGRMHLWLESWQMSLQKFPLGMGPHSWNTHVPLTEAYAASRNFSHPHNMYLLWAAEFGWLSVSGLFIIGLVALRRFWDRRRVLLGTADNFESSMFLCGFTASVIAAVIHAGFSAVFLAPASMLLGLVILAAFWLQISPGNGGDKALTEAPVRAGRALLMVLVVFTMSLWVHQVLIYHQAMIEDRESDRGYYDRLKPRFWLHGDFPRYENVGN